jgi:hypothetical protein
VDAYLTDVDPATGKVNNRWFTQNAMTGEVSGPALTSGAVIGGGITRSSPPRSNSGRGCRPPRPATVGDRGEGDFLSDNGVVLHHLPLRGHLTNPVPR